jgi:hypothetical protein
MPFMKAYRREKAWELNVTKHIRVHADINLLGGNINTINTSSFMEL